jgi:hypothetical protein
METGQRAWPIKAEEEEGGSVLYGKAHRTLIHTLATEAVFTFFVRLRNPMTYTRMTQTH